MIQRINNIKSRKNKTFYVTIPIAVIRKNKINEGDYIEFFIDKIIRQKNKD